MQLPSPLWTFSFKVLDERVGEWDGKIIGILTPHGATARATATVTIAFTVHHGGAETPAEGIQEYGVKGVNQFIGHLPKDKHHNKAVRLRKMYKINSWPTDFFYKKETSLTHSTRSRTNTQCWQHSGQEQTRISGLWL